jgi:hypothetical protein
LSQWLYGALREAGPAVELLETRHVKTPLSTIPVKTDRNNARGIAQLMRLHCKSMAAQEVRHGGSGAGLVRTTRFARTASGHRYTRNAYCCQWKHVRGRLVIGEGVETTHGTLVIGEGVETTQEYAAERRCDDDRALRSGCGRDPDRLAWMHPSG